MRVLELFAGIGACSKALKRIGIDVEIVDAVEIDKYAMASFNAIHNTNFEVQDITSYNKDLKDIELITHGSPCQDFSVAGKQAGGDLGSGTRSSLMYETIRIVGKIRPKYVLWENVKNILSKKHKHNFDAYIETMNILGYNSYYQVLNAKDYGIPQNRERVYTVSIRKDIDKGIFKFPEKEELKLRLKDMLEEEVDEKYYLSEKMQDYVLDFNNKQKGTAWEGRADEEKLNSDIAHAIGVRSAGGNQRAGVSNFVVDGLDNEIKVKDFKIKIKNATKKGYDEATDGDSVNLQYPDSNTRRGRVGHQISQTLMANDSMGVVEGIKVIGNYMPSNHDASRVVDSNGLAPTVKENHGTVTAVLETINKNAKHQQDLIQDKNNICRCIPAGTHGSTPHLLKTIVDNEPLKIRKLTPKECWRLMGFDDEDFEKAKAIPMSNTQLYKQAGNSIVVNVLEKIFKNLF
ncbi:MAG TPA: hypothetical protein DEP51_04055 [Clostridiales bacterium]|nr:hypothetical protein [Clostridiales bacterium]